MNNLNITENDDDDVINPLQIICSSNAIEVCARSTTVHDLISCIFHHKSKCHQNNLSSGNLSSESGNGNDDDDVSGTERQIVIEVYLAFVYLLIPVILMLWATRKMFLFLKESSLQMSKSTNDYEGRGEDVGSEEGEESMQLERHQPPPMDLSFLKISFFVKLHSSTYFGIFRSYRKNRVLDRVTGTFRAHQMSAIMGPSGSGKTTLLKLIGGRMYHGEFYGIRSINSEVPPANVYDSDMRAQGFVAQTDVLLPQLTIWQTIMFAALLRMPPRGHIQEKLKRARAVISDMGLLNVRDHLVGTPNGSQKCISGGQRRRLSIAQELIGSPSVMFLDEPTSGLDASNSLRIIQLLHFISRKRGSSIILTIHQPRSEAFDLFDSLILLGQGGQMVYSGSCRSAHQLLTSCPAIPLETTRCDNPGDFIIDVLGLENEESEIQESSNFDHSSRSLHNSESSDQDDLSLHSSNEFESFMKPPQRKLKPDLSYELSNHFLQSTEYIILLRNVKEDINILKRPLDLDYRDTGVRSHTPIHKSTSTSSSSKFQQTKDLPKDLPIDRHRNQHYNRDRDRYSEEDEGEDEVENEDEDEENRDDLFDDFDEELGNKSIPMMELSSEDRMLREMVEKSGEALRKPFFSLPSILSDVDAGRTSQLAGNWLEVKTLQLWVLFSRRVVMLTPRPVDLLWQICQMTLIALVISIAFSYKVESKLEEPYQIFMLIFTLSSYAMILQYLILVPEYYSERNVTFVECSSGISSYGAYILAVTLTEIPRCLLHCLLLYGVMYLVHPLNPSFLHTLFAFLCLMVGVSAWQSVLCICSVVSDNISVAYTLAFLVIGSGTLFGGLLVSFPNIPEIFRYVYYFSVTAVTQRALIVNDMNCCYLTLTCNSFESDIVESQESFFSRSSSFSTSSTPTSETNNSTASLCSTMNEEGNLGRYALELLSLDNISPMMSLIFLMWSSFICRCVAIVILTLKERFHYRLRHVDEDFLLKNWKNLRNVIHL